MIVHGDAKVKFMIGRRVGEPIHAEISRETKLDSAITGSLNLDSAITGSLNTALGPC